MLCREPVCQGSLRTLLLAAAPPYPSRRSRMPHDDRKHNDAHHPEPGLGRPDRSRGRMKGGQWRRALTTTMTHLKPEGGRCRRHLNVERHCASWHREEKHDERMGKEHARWPRNMAEAALGGLEQRSHAPTPTASGSNPDRSVMPAGRRGRAAGRCSPLHQRCFRHLLMRAPTAGRT